jgi:hypothetical protein
MQSQLWPGFDLVFHHRKLLWIMYSFYCIHDSSNLKSETENFNELIKINSSKHMLHLDWTSSYALLLLLLLLLIGYATNDVSSTRAAE